MAPASTRGLTLVGAICRVLALIVSLGGAALGAYVPFGADGDRAFDVGGDD